jgi:2-hydroxy-3-keto-5-methylthiopentenyl-1-phosphate phosphatase
MPLARVTSAVAPAAGPARAAGRVQLVVDWDGTVTERDTLTLTLRNFVDPALFERVESEVDAELEAGTMTLREVMRREFAMLTAPLDDVIAFLLEHARVRPGFAEFVERFDPLILSSSFHETIEPVLAREGVTARVRANRVDARANGWRIRWMSETDCPECGEPCKRGSLPDGGFVYVGDGYSDRCAALAASRVFARDGLARYLDERGVAYERFTDFRGITAALK